MRTEYNNNLSGGARVPLASLYNGKCFHAYLIDGVADVYIKISSDADGYPNGEIQAFNTRENQLRCFSKTAKVWPLQSELHVWPKYQ